MIGGLDGTPAWVILMMTYEVDEKSAAVTVAVHALAVMESEEAARELAYDLGPYYSPDAQLMIEEAVMVDPL